MKIMDTYQRKNYFKDLVCFIGSDNDNYNKMSFFFHNLNFFLVFDRDERVQYLSLSVSSFFFFLRR